MPSKAIGDLARSVINLSLESKDIKLLSIQLNKEQSSVSFLFTEYCNYSSPRHEHLFAKWLKVIDCQQLAFREAPQLAQMIVYEATQHINEGKKDVRRINNNSNSTTA